MRSLQGPGKDRLPLLPWDLPEFCAAFRCQISVSGTECRGYLLDSTRSEGGKMRRSDGLQQLKVLLFVSFSGVIFPYYVPAS